MQLQNEAFSKIQKFFENFIYITFLQKRKDVTKHKWLLLWSTNGPIKSATGHLTVLINNEK